MLDLAAIVVVGLAVCARPESSAPAQPAPRQAARDAEREWQEIQERQRQTRESYRRPEFQPDAAPPDNAALWYGLLPKSARQLVDGPGPGFLWTVFDYDNERYGLRPAPGLDYRPSQAEFQREAHRLVIDNARAIDLFVRASRIEHCDFEAAAHLWEAEENQNLRRPAYALRLFFRVVYLDARSQWTSGHHRLALERIAAVVRCGRHIELMGATGPFTAQSATRWAMDEALRALAEWPDPGPSEHDGRELAEALGVLDPADPHGTAAQMRADALRFAEWLVAESAANGTGPELGDRVRDERLVMQSQNTSAEMLEARIFVVHDGPLPLETMAAAQIETAVAEALPRLERVYQMMLERGRQAEIEAEYDAALKDPEFIEPLLLIGTPGVATMMEEWRQKREAVLSELGVAEP